MKSFDWFGVVFGFIGLISILSGCYEWSWLWRFARGIYLPDHIGQQRTRIVYIIFGIFALTVGINFVLESIFILKSSLFFAVGLVISGVLTVVLFNFRGKESFQDFIVSALDVNGKDNAAGK